MKMTDSKISLHIAKRMAKLRAKKKLSLQNIATRAGMSKVGYWQIERGRSVPSVETLWQLSKAFGVPVSYWYRRYKE